ncbi:MAG: 4-hydroxy-3-methylbut-2-enyl diphosphate reductase, partial [Deltaproteobacteria bacterium RIFCSPLOWO2_01_FULL_42_9]
KRAINMAQDCAKEATGNIYTLGPIIHNPQVVKELEESGISKVDKVEEINNGTIIVRSHGVTSDEMKLIQEKGLEIIDATCPFVKKAHEYVELLTREGYSVIVVGEKEHPEVKGILSYGRKDIIAAASVEDLKDMPRRKKIGIVAQTTQSIENLQAVVAHCLKKASELKIFNTICNATSVRQQESIELAKQVDCMIVVGGRNSANTNRLTEICRKIQPKTYHIEVPEELNQIQFNGAKNVGITAGASTPNWIIEKVIEALKDRG